MSRPTSFTLYAAVWDTDIAVYCGGSLARANKLFRRRLKIADVEIEDRPSIIGSNLRIDGIKPTAIWFRDVKPSGSIVAHEAMHATIWVLAQSGVSLTPESEEAYAYMVGWIVREIGKRVW